MSESNNLEARIEDLSIKLQETMLTTDLNDSQYLEKTIGLILTSVKDILHFNCAEFFLFKNLDGSIPKKGEIGTDPRKKTDMRLHWITGMGYEEDYMKVAKGAIFNINYMPRGPPVSLFNPQFDFQPLLWYDNEEDMKKLEEKKRVMTDFFKERQQVYNEECNPADFPRGGFSEWLYQVYLPVTREIPEGKEMIGLMCIDSPLDIPLNEAPDEERMKAVLKITKLAQAPLLTASMVYELKTTNNKLETTLTELKDAQATIVEQEKMITEQSMAGGFAHEIRNALSPISTYLAILGGTGSKRGIIDTLGLSIEEKEKLLGRLGKIKGQTDYALDITSMIMNYGKIERDKACEEVQVRPLLEEIVKSKEDEFREKSISFSNNLNYDGIVYSNPTQIRQVVENLIINSEYAVENSEKKEIVLSLDYLKEPDAFYSNGNCIRIVVSDSGCGIDDLNKEKIFRPFFTTRPNKKGAGLGLATSKRIAKLYNGDLVFESNKGKTDFRFYLPIGEKKE